MANHPLVNHVGSGSDAKAHHLREFRFRVGQMDCSSCLAKIERHLKSVDGVGVVTGSVISRTLTVAVDESRVREGDVRAEVGRLGYVAETIEDEAAEAPPRTWATPQSRRTLAAVAISLLAALTRLATADPVIGAIPLYDVTPSVVLFVLAAIVVGWNFFPKGLAAARHLSLDMNFLMSVAIVGAVILGEVVEAASIAVLFSVAELLEAYSVDRARASIRSLLKMAPDWATVLRGGLEVTVPAASLVAGDEVMVRPGDRIPADGTVISGGSAVDQSPITGESLPVEKLPGDPVFSGTINREGHLTVRIDRPARDSALAKIARLVEEAESKKSKTERFVDRFSRFYTPVITASAVAIGVFPPLLFDAPAEVWVLRALTLLVIACPCALVISTPVAVVSGLTAAARHGVLIKGGAYLEALANVRVIALDKTGTLTVGHPVVQEVIPVRGEATEALAHAAAIERRSEHPLARAIVEAAEARGLPTSLVVTDFQAIPGKGVRAIVNGEVHLVGGPSLFPSATVPDGLQDRGHSVVGVARGDAVLCWISIADEPRPNAAAAIRELEELGIDRIVMLTGDNQATANAIGTKVGIRDVRAGLLPEDKLQVLQGLEREHGGVAMVGDGVNDGPALAAATVGIAMGAAGSDTALETADVALMGDDLERLPYLVQLSRRARSVIRQNIVAAIAVKGVLAIGVPLGYVSLIAAVLIGDLGVSLAVTANALRLGRVGQFQSLRETTS
jgi:Cd2+/Zn2+-exporting ATPase